MLKEELAGAIALLSEKGKEASEGPGLRRRGKKGEQINLEYWNFE